MSTRTFTFTVQSSTPPPTNWLPAVGARASVSLNTISSVYDTANADFRLRGGRGILTAWVGTTYASALGQYGSILVQGGGHADYLGDEVYRYDLATRTWSRIYGPRPIPVSPAYGSQVNDPTDGPFTGTGVGDQTYYEYWTDNTKSAVITNAVMPTHTYGHVNYVPPSIAGNTSGWFVMSGMRRQAHYLNLDNPSAGFLRMGGLMPNVEEPGYGVSIVDRIRNRIWIAPHSNGSQGYAYAISLPGMAVSQVSSNYPSVYYYVGFHSVSDDAYITAQCQKGAPNLQIIDPGANTKHTPPTSGTAPTAVTTAEWIESRRQLVTWDGTTNDLYFAQAPANPRTGTWVWTKQSFGGDAVQTLDASAPMYARLHWVDSLGAFFIVAETTKPVQAWKL